MKISYEEESMKNMTMYYALYPEAVEFCESINKEGVTATFSHICGSYDKSTLECNPYEIKGETGNQGSNSLYGSLDHLKSLERFPCPKHLQCLNIKFDITNEWLTDERMQLLKKLFIRTGKGCFKERLWEFRRLTANKRFKFVYLKKPFFNEMFNIYKTHVPHAVEDDLLTIGNDEGECNSYNYKFVEHKQVEEDYEPDGNCLEITYETVTRYTGYTTLGIKTTIEDLDRNKEVILELLSQL